MSSPNRIINLRIFNDCETTALIKPCDEKRKYLSRDVGINDQCCRPFMCFLNFWKWCINDKFRVQGVSRDTYLTCNFKEPTFHIYLPNWLTSPIEVKFFSKCSLHSTVDICASASQKNESEYFVLFKWHPIL